MNKHNINLEKRDKFGNSFLNTASQTGNVEIIKVLILNGAVLDTQNNLGNTPLHHTYSYKSGKASCQFSKCMDVLIGE